MSEKQNNRAALKKMLRKFNLKELTPQEELAVNAWYDALDQEGAAADPRRELQSKERIAQHILADQQAAANNQPSTHWFGSPFLKYAACLTLLGISIYFIFKPAAKISQTGYRLVASTGNNRKNIKLADGSVIMLNAASSVSIAKDFNVKDRRIKLTGEAFFKITADKTRPFIIRSEDLNTTVLGTSFNISSYPDLEELKIAVSSGKVKVARIAAGQKEMLLSPGMVKNQILVYNHKSKEMEIKTGEAGLYSAWTNNELYIDNASVQDIARQLSRYYHVKTNVDPGIAATDRYTIKLGDDGLDAATQILTQLTKYKFYHQQNQIYIMKQN